ncbi:MULTISPECIES: hypothetical protein [unclassified Mesorhizobium]|uniref:hypothetical protein n=1 Tax=unclassified Mesorhizobium TaxID=325217 RepID=UPI000FE7F8CD|nr:MULTISPECIES: hypothetical protein [unclassified Mesorhizobium]RWH25248.1 MAG: hypothetical protein EOQ76_19675 [Mesorhizobium sp.]RWH35570.1 MAG: hypothetical protein EOQ79_21010 [Mesorhizobium sp.]TGS85772.1 hypothetical protein EN818_17530 [Mesorhizobium sp. M3A.F.Ca.ET.175.01.1.1]TGT23918.1 hypothetical protein EN817_20810 [Mesorhizobium sp. M3A.F.Ca.ET.174.01.1.1]TIR57945.1 MAG: hypothetical protein E5X22_21450 [Mesorhizobium sp.]
MFAPRLPGFASGNLLTFGAEANTRGPQERDQFIILDPSRVCEVLDFRNVDAEVARVQIVERGLSRLLPGTDTVVAALAEGVCVVVKLVRHPAAKLFVADMAGLERLELRRFDDRLFQGDRIDGHWISVPEVSVGPVVGALNWCRDADFLDSVLKRIRKLVPQGPAPTRAQISHVVTQLTKAELMPADGSDIDPMLARLRAFGPALSRNIRNLDEIVEIVEAIEPIQQRLESELSGRRSELEAEIRRDLENRARKEIETSQKDLLASRAALEREVSDLRPVLKELEEAADLARNNVADARASIVCELGHVLEQLGDAPPDVDEPIRALSSRLASRLKETAEGFEVISSSGAPWTRPSFARVSATPWSEFSKALDSAALRSGHAREDLILADAAARSGKLVLLPEAVGSHFAECYARLMTGSDLVRHALDPSMIAVDDLWRQPGFGAPTAFARAWAAARLDPTRYRLVLLDGVHRTPTDLWMPTFADILEGERRPTNLLVFATLGGPFIDGARVWSGMKAATVPLSPIRPTRATPEFLSRVVGRPLAMSVFEANVAPVPSRENILKLVSDVEDDDDAAVLGTVVAVYRAAWPLGSEEAAVVAMALAGRGNRLGNGLPPSAFDARLAAGVSWLANALQSEL